MSIGQGKDALRGEAHFAVRPEGARKIFPIKPWLLVFDLDGTLIDSSEDLCAAVNAALAAIGRGALSQDQVKRLVGDGAASLIRRAISSSDKGASMDSPEVDIARCFSTFLAYYHEHKLDHTRTYPGVNESLASIRDRNPDLLMAVLTNKPVRPSREICSALGLARYFFANYGGNSFATKKPAPEGLHHVLQEARRVVVERSSDQATLPAHGVVMIGDSDADVLAGRACGTRTLGCTYGLAPETLLLAGPDAVVTSARDWPDVLGL